MKLKEKVLQQLQARRAGKRSAARLPRLDRGTLRAIIRQAD